MASSTIEFGTTLQQLDAVIKEREFKNLDGRVTQFMRNMQKEMSALSNTPRENITPELLNTSMTSISAATEVCNDKLAKLAKVNNDKFAKVNQLQQQQEGLLACLKVVDTCNERTKKRIADGDFYREEETAKDNAVMVEVKHETDSALGEFEGH